MTKTQNDRITEILTTLEEGVMDVFEQDSWQQYLQTMSHFHSYSINNTMLIYRQKPDATFVAGFHTWKVHFGRYVKRGEKGIQILVPMKRLVEKKDSTDDSNYYLFGFRSAYVFDISQTDGDPLPSCIIEELKGNIKDFTFFMSALKILSPCPITYASFPDQTHGSYNKNSNEIKLQENMSERMTVKTCIHEIAHALLHHTDNGEDLNTKEIEAESIAFAVCSYYGIDTSDYSFSYIARWSSSKNIAELKNSIHTIKLMADRMITTIDQVLYPFQNQNDIMTFKKEIPEGTSSLIL